MERSIHSHGYTVDLERVSWSGLEERWTLEEVARREVVEQQIGARVVARVIGLPRRRQTYRLAVVGASCPLEIQKLFQGLFRFWSAMSMGYYF